MVRVLFVCLGNICRSPSAEGVARRLAEHEGLSSRLEFDSAGTAAYHVGEPPDPRMQESAARRGLDLATFRARQVNRSDFSSFDYLLAMDSSNLEVLREMCPEGWRGHLGLLMEFAPEAGFASVPDPYYGGSAGFERVLDLLEEASEGLITHLRRRHGF
ncbi:MAG TPA: low molecular weight protein-tyrosine-phosphatase [Gammaproteobacteria bacterium]|nr:low molecular weight protein-tyrosine-phosphatase [Gammaproteobacteria bacterium]